MLTKKELGVKAAEYAIKQLKAEFGHDFSKGEFGNLRDRLQNCSAEPLLARSVEDIIDGSGISEGYADYPSFEITL